MEKKHHKQVPINWCRLTWKLCRKHTRLLGLFNDSQPFSFSKQKTNSYSIYLLRTRRMLTLNTCTSIWINTLLALSSQYLHVLLAINSIIKCTDFPHLVIKPPDMSIFRERQKEFLLTNIACYLGETLINCVIHPLIPGEDTH